MRTLSRTRTMLVGLLSACLALAGLALSPATANAEPVITPVGTWLPTQFGQVRIAAASPAKTSYAVGDVVTLTFRMESNATAPARNIVGSSTTLANASSCNWANFPGGTAGKYDCAVRNATRNDPHVTYTVTEADAAAGQAIYDMTWTETPTAGGTPVVTTIHGSLPVTRTTPTPDPYLEVTLTRNGTGDVRVGDTISYTVTYTNLSDQTITAFPRTSNLDGMLTTGTPNCRWAALAPGATQSCTTGSHTVIAADLVAGSFTGTVTFDATTDREGTTVLQRGIVATSPAVTVVDAPAGPREEGQYVTLATAGYAGFTCHRIPALTQANNGWILASWDGRPGGCGDAPNPNSIVQRISKDGGQTWEPATVIAAGKTTAPVQGYSDPSYVVDRETGRIFNFFVLSYDVGWHAAHDPSNPRRVMHGAVIHSDDNGATWSEPRNITASLDALTEGGTTYTKFFATSGEGIQLRYGEHAGRLVQQYAFAHANGTYAFSAYSDDHGATWQTGEKVGPGMDENKTVELSDGRVMLNSRAPGTGARLISISEDGGETWGPLYVDRALTDPTNNASITRAFPNAPEGSAQAKMLLFSNANSTSGRVNGTIKLSYDDGQTWSVAKVFEPGSMSYSTLTPLAYGPNPQPGVYGLLFEGTSSTIRYMQVSLDWLGGLPVALSAETQTVNRGENTVTVEVTNVGSENLTGLTLAPTAPAGWSVSAAEPFDLAAGASKELTLTVTAPDWADAGAVRLPVSVRSADGEAQGAVNLTIALLEGQHPAESVPVTIVGTLPAQPGEEPSKMFDGDTTTMWHTPWRTTVELPLDIDLTVGDTAKDLAYLEMTPRQSGGSNGRITEYELYAGDSLDDLTLISSGTLANDSSVKRLPLDTTARFVRLRVIDAVTDQAIQFVSIAELAIKVAVPDDEAPVVTAPVVTAISNQTAVEGTAITPIAVAATGTEPTITVTGLPAGLTYADGRITGTPTAVGSSTVTVKATNSAGTDTKTFTLTVTSKPVAAPVLGAIEDATVELGAAVSVRPSATGTGVTYTATGLPAGVTLNATTGAISGTPAAVGTSTVTVTATNAGGSDSDSFQLVVRDTTTPTVGAISNVAVTEGSAVSVQVAGTDRTALTYSATGLPAGVTISATGLISGTPTAVGTSQVTVRVVDAHGNATTRSFTITVNPKPVAAPVLASINDASVEFGTAVSVRPSATGTGVTYTATGLPAGVTINATTGAISGTPATVGTSTVTVTATNAGGSDSDSFVLSVRDTTAPVIAAQRNVITETGQRVSVQVRATDLSDITYSATPLPVGVTIDPATGLISGTPTAEGVSWVDVVATDAHGNSSTMRFGIAVQLADTVAPMIIVSAQHYLVLGMPAEYVNIRTRDSYGVEVTVEVSGLPAGLRFDAATGTVVGTPTKLGTSTVTVTATDESGNVAVETFRITVQPKPAVVPPKFPRTFPYTQEGDQWHNGRRWRTVCEDYSQTERCRTEIWATVVKRVGNSYVRETGWAFNNLTYLPFMTRAHWTNNPLGFATEWTGTDGAQWKTECDTAATGSNACRTYRLTTVYYATPRPAGGYLFGQETKWVFNNIVMFGNYSR